MSFNKTALKSAIEGISSFDRELVSGAGVKGVMAAIGAKSRDLYQVPVSDIVVIDGLNPRVPNQAYLDGVQALSEDIERLGYWQDKPLAGYIAKIDGKDVIALQDGHRRYAAVLLAIARGVAIQSLPMVIKDKSQNMVDLTLALMHSNEGQPFNMYEKSILAKRLKGFGWENGAIAVEMRCTPAFVGQLLSLAGSPKGIQELVKNGHLSGTQALDLMKAHGEDAADVAESKVAAAKAKGNNRATKKDAATPEQQKEKRAKAKGYELYQAFVALCEEKKVMDVISREAYDRLDAIMTHIEKVKEAPEPKPKKTVAAKQAPTKKAAKK